MTSHWHNLTSIQIRRNIKALAWVFQNAQLLTMGPICTGTHILKRPSRMKRSYICVSQQRQLSFQQTASHSHQPLQCAIFDVYHERVPGRQQCQSTSHGAEELPHWAHLTLKITRGNKMVKSLSFLVVCLTAINTWTPESNFHLPCCHHLLTISKHPHSSILKGSFPSPGLRVSFFWSIQQLLIGHNST